MSKDAKLAIIRPEPDSFKPGVYWYLTLRCNLACSHCWVSSSPSVDTSGELTTAECLQVVDQLAELQASHVIFTGGEPLMRRDALELMAAVADRGMSVGVESNGVLIDNRFVALARDLQDRGLFALAISVDGGTAEIHEQIRGKGSFERTLKALHLLKENGVSFTMQAILNRVNQSTVPDLYELAKELKPSLRSLVFGFLSPVGRGQELSNEFGLAQEDLLVIFEKIKQAKSDYDGMTTIKLPPGAIPTRFTSMVLSSEDVTYTMGCPFPMLGILPDGNVTVCAVAREVKELQFGKVTTTRLREMWMKHRLSDLRARYLAAEGLSGICGDCIWAKACRGSCRAWAYEAGGSFDAPYPICQQLAEEGRFPSSFCCKPTALSANEAKCPR